MPHNNNFQVSRGFAYIKFRSRDLATRAMQELNGHGYGHLILKVERAKPSNRDSAPQFVVYLKHSGLHVI